MIARGHFTRPDAPIRMITIEVDPTTGETIPMPRNTSRVPMRRLAPTAVAISLALGWAWREVARATERSDALASKTRNLEDIKMGVFKDGENPVGKIGLYFQGETPGCASFVTGRFVLDPGKSPHPPHVHEDEEILIVESGRGEVICDGKTTPVGPGSVMYSTPNVAHGINNTGSEPLTFYFVKWTPKGPSPAR
jgi:mannose-6-phosphate isomerase-like protein (cupin superfamily)